jgi:cytochrome c5
MRVFVPLAAVLFSGGAMLVDAAAEIAGERSGEQIVKSQCAGCHEKGLHGAPRIDDRAAWVPRLKNGLDATVRSAIKGHGAMPSRGGISDLTDTELRSAVVYLFNPAGPPPKAPEPPPLAANQRIVDGIEVFLGMKPVKQGVQHLTITLRDAKSHAAIGDAQVEVSVTNPVMGTDSRKLDRVSAGGAVSYANEFRVSGREPHVINVKVRRPGNLKVIETRFDYKG